MTKYHKDGTLPENGEVFVFGSNLAGIHGAGAAKVAFERFGAKWGIGSGISGLSFAIPTKDTKIQTLSLEQIEVSIARFNIHTLLDIEGTQWFVTRVGCGLAGYKDADIAPLFKEAQNCSFAEEWRQYLES